MFEVKRICRCGERRMALDRNPGPVFSIHGDEIYFATVPHDFIVGQWFALHCPICGDNHCTFSIENAGSKPMHVKPWEVESGKKY